MIDKTEKRWQAMYYELAARYAELEAKFNQERLETTMPNEEEISRLAVMLYNGLQDQRKAADRL